MMSFICHIHNYTEYNEGHVYVVYEDTNVYNNMGMT